MKQAPALKQDFASAVAGWDAGERSTGAPWLIKLRREAAARFRELGLPGPRDEEWRETSVAAVAATAFALPAAGAGARAGSLPGLARVSDGALRLVFVDGHFSPALSSTAGKTKFEVSSLAAALRSAPERLEPDFARIAAWNDRAFGALNAAWFADGGYVAIPDGVIADEPIHLVHVASGGATPTASFPRGFIRVGKGARATVVETYVSLDDGARLTAATTEAVVGDDASLVHVRIQDESHDAFHIGQVQYQQGRDSRVHSLQVSLGAALARFDFGAVLGGPGAECTMDGLYLADRGQHVDHHTTLDHAAPHCQSHEMYKGVLGERARAVFNGRIIVRPGAQKTDAKQSNKNLLLAGDALVHTRPQLEIFADDVKCTHGATIGRLDPDALFYLRSRGIGADEARNVLIHAFTAAVLNDRIPGALRSVLDEDFARRLATRGGRAA